MARFIKVDFIKGGKRVHLEEMLDNFMELKCPYAKIDFEEGEYIDSYSCASTYKAAIIKYGKEDKLDCRTINGVPYLINKNLAGIGVKK